jgi:hypothetical protein
MSITKGVKSGRKEKGERSWKREVGDKVGEREKHRIQ